jgi:hypothetical protein
MAIETPNLEQIIRDIEGLSTEDRVRLIGRIVHTLLPLSPTNPHRPLIYGEFHGPRLSCEEDFREAEWYPQDGDNDGR